MRASLLVLCTTALVVALSGVTPAQQPLTDLTLEQALAMALRSSPSLAARERALLAAGARVDQAGLLPNPELDLEMENFGGRGALSGFDAAESTATISQPILLGGKRRRRRAVAETRRALVADELAAGRLDLVTRTTTAFVAVLVAQERAALGDEQLALARSVANTVQIRVDAGRVSPVEAARAEIEVSKTQVRFARARRELEGTRIRLAETWGSTAPGFGRAIGDMPGPMRPPPLEQLTALLRKTPEISRLENQVRHGESVLKLESSLRVPDLRVSIGTQRFEEIGQSAWVAGISLPIPIFDRNQGARRAASFEIERARHQAEAGRVALEAGLAVALKRLSAAADEVAIVTQEVVPLASAAFASVETGYREGKFGFLDVLDAQRSLFDARSLLLDSQQELLLSRTELERRIGRSIKSLAQGEQR